MFYQVARREAHRAVYSNIPRPSLSSLLKQDMLNLPQDIILTIRITRTSMVSSQCPQCPQLRSTRLRIARRSARLRKDITPPSGPRSKLSNTSIKARAIQMLPSWGARVIPLAVRTLPSCPVTEYIDSHSAIPLHRRQIIGWSFEQFHYAGCVMVFNNRKY